MSSISDLSQTPMDQSNLRSWLVVPADKYFEFKAELDSWPDALVLDLVEFVSERGKAAARKGLASIVASARQSCRSAIFIQIDPLMIAEDLDSGIWPGVSGVVVTRTESPQQIADVEQYVSGLERERGISASMRIVALLETAQGNQAAHEICRSSPRLSHVSLGRADLVMDLRPEPSGELYLMPYLMQRLIIVAGATGLVPLGAWWKAPDRGLLATSANTLEAARRGKAIGFKGAFCMLPEQVAALNQGFRDRTQASH